MLETNTNEDRPPTQQELLGRLQHIGDKNISDADIQRLGRVIGDNLPFHLETPEELGIALATEKLRKEKRMEVAKILDEIAERMAFERSNTMPDLTAQPGHKRPEKPN